MRIGFFFLYYNYNNLTLCWVVRKERKENEDWVFLSRLTSELAHYNYEKYVPLACHNY